MEMFAFREELVAEYERYSSRLTNLRSSDVSREVGAALVGGSFRSAPHVQLNPHLKARGWGDDLVGDGALGAQERRCGSSGGPTGNGATSVKWWRRCSIRKPSSGWRW